MSAFWDSHALTIDLERFRAPDQYLEQLPEPRYLYRALVQHIVEIGKGDWLRTLGEDGAFGCLTVDVDGLTVSRDLLDSILELSFLEATLGTDVRLANVLDIGAGYGRLAHRMTAAWPMSFVWCTDPVDVSRGVCERYLSYRGVRHARVVHPDDLALDRAIDLAVNIHSWSECTRDEVAWWMDWLVAHHVPHLFVIPHMDDCACVDGGEFRSVIEGHGYTLAHSALRWPTCSQRTYYLFTRHP